MRNFCLWVLLLFAWGCATAQWQGDHSREELASFRALLSTDGTRVVLYDVTAFSKRVWTSIDGHERPSQDIPHCTLFEDDLAILATLVEPTYLKTGEAEFLGYSYIVEVLRGNVPVGRIDLHTKGFGGSSLMLIHTPYSAHLLLSRDGEFAWLGALDAAWKRRSKER